MSKLFKDIKSDINEPITGLVSTLVTDYKEVDNEKGGYLQIEFTILEPKKYKDRVLKHTIFATQKDGNPNTRSVEYFIGAVGQQVGLLNTKEKDIYDVLDHAKKEKATVNITVSRNAEFKTQNLNFSNYNNDNEIVEDVNHEEVE